MTKLKIGDTVKPPFNLALHEHLLAQGYSYQHQEAEFDGGDAENGPGTWGSPEYDEYTGPDEHVFANEMGRLDRQPRDLELEKWLDQQAIDQ